MIQLSPIFRMTTASFSQSFAVDSTFPENLLELLITFPSREWFCSIPGYLTRNTAGFWDILHL